jgi:hypothetical protein
VQDFILEGYRASGDGYSVWNRGRPLAYGFEWGKLPLAVAEPGPLIERAVRIAGTEGLTLQRLRETFDHLGQERLNRGLAWARGARMLDERREMRPNRAGRGQEQVVLYARGDTH